jgi:putative SOS response-associated peptidase YedK
MCGRYASARKRIELLEEFSVQRDRVTEPLEPDYNVAPTKPVYAVLTRRGRAESVTGPQASADDQADAGKPELSGSRSVAGSGPAGSATGSDSGPAGSGSGDGAGQPVARELRVVRWGLVPYWAKDISIGSRLINARAETVSEKPAFRRAFARRRCLLPADGYYEWQRLADGAKPAKQPFYITRSDGGPLAFAGLYELWRDRAHPDGDPDAWLWTASIITTTAPDDLGRIHDRMPMVIDPGSFQDWLDPANSDPGDLLALLAPAAAGGLTSYPVSTAVNSVRNNGPDLIERVEPATQLSASTARSGSSRGGPSPAVPGSDPGTLF